MDPHHPPTEQQLPNVLPAHVYLFVPPHVPSVDTVGPVVVVHPLPKPVWQPAPQYALVVPHHPPAEQHVPKVLPAHVYLFVPPHVPSGETVAPVGVLEALAVVVVDEALAVVVADEAAALLHPELKAALQPVPQ